MALSANTVWEVRTAGNDTNGGGFVTGATGNDYSLQDSKNTVGSDISTADAVANGTTTITSATANFSTGIVGNIIYFAGGTGAITGVWRQCTARTNATTITIDASIAASTGMTMNIGGAIQSPAIVAVSAVAGNLVFIKTGGIFLITTASTNIAGGCVSTAVVSRWVGYSTTRTFGNTDTKPLIQINAGVATATIFAGNNLLIRNMEMDGQAQTTSIFGSGTSNAFIDCRIENFTASPTAVTLIHCDFLSCSATQSTASSTAIDCTFTANTAVPCTSSAFNCVSYSNTGASTDGFAPGSNRVVVNCTAYNNGRGGILLGSNSGAINCISESNTGNNYDATAAGVGKYLFNCAWFGGGGGVGTNITAAQQVNIIALGVSSFVNAAGSNFALNNAATGGALLRQLGYPSTLATGTTNNYIDIGAAQAQSAIGTAYAFVG